MRFLTKLTDLDGAGLQARANMDEQTISDYEEIYREHGTDIIHGLPPVQGVFNEATGHVWLTDGFHRVEAARRAGLEKIVCDQTCGTHKDALAAALKANVKNGLQRTNADKRKALEMAWAARKELFGGEPSHAVLADACGVSKSTARKFREEILTMLKKHSQEGGELTMLKKHSQEDGELTMLKKHSQKDGELTMLKKHSQEGRVIVGRDHRITHARSFAAVKLLDGVGQEVPDEFRPYFEKNSARQLLGELHTDIVRFERAYSTDPVMQRCLSQSKVVNIRATYEAAKLAMPYAICPSCHGKGCDLCQKRGFFDKVMYSALPAEVKFSDQKVVPII